jgi:hypothetical protein
VSGLTVGMRGSVDLSELDVGGIPCRLGTVAPGVVEVIGEEELTVRLEAPFGGVDVLEITPDRFSPTAYGTPPR